MAKPDPAAAGGLTQVQGLFTDPLATTFQPTS
jgi:hypothetical protein